MFIKKPPFKPEEIRSLLVISSKEMLGDGLVRLPFVQALADVFPNAHRTWLTREHSVYAGLLKPIVSPYLHECIEYVHFGETGYDYVRRRFPERSFDLIIDTGVKLNRSFAAWRIHHDYFYGQAGGYLLSDFKPLPGTESPICSARDDLMRQLSHILGHPIKAPPARIILASEYTQKARALLPDGSTYIGLAPGAGGHERRWPLPRFVLLARHIISRRMTPVFLLGPEEESWYAELKTLVPEAQFPLQAAGKQDIFLTMALSRQLRGAISNDCGTAHLMATAGLSLLMLYGPSDPGEYVQNTPHLHHIFAHEGARAPMEDLPVEKVIQAFDQVFL